MANTDGASLVFIDILVVRGQMYAWYDVYPMKLLGREKLSRQLLRHSTSRAIVESNCNK